MTHLEWSYGTHELFVFGDTVIRSIAVSRDSFTAVAVQPHQSWDFPLLDLHTFFQPSLVPGPPTGPPYTVGVTYPLCMPRCRLVEKKKFT